MSLGVFGTVDRFMETAHTPHFMQMHLGSLDKRRMQTFVDGHQDVVAWEAIKYLNVENFQLRFNDQTRRRPHVDDYNAAALRYHRRDPLVHSKKRAVFTKAQRKRLDKIWWE